MLSQQFEEEEALTIEQIKGQVKKYDGGEITLRKDEKTGIAFLCIDYEGKKNCFTPKMMVDLSNTLGELESWDTGKGLILYSRGDTFSSGSNLKVVKELLDDPSTAYKLSRLMQDSFQRFRKLPLVSVSVVQGKAIGGGGEMMMFTDYRLFTPEASFAFIEGRMGLTLAWGVLKPLVEKVGRSSVLDYLLTGREVKLEEALRSGIADAQVTGGSDETNRVEEAVAWLQSKIQGLPTRLVRAQKRFLQSESLLEERQVFASLWGTPEHRLALSKLGKWEDK